MNIVVETARRVDSILRTRGGHCDHDIPETELRAFLAEQTGGDEGWPLWLLLERYQLSFGPANPTPRRGAYDLPRGNW